MTYDWKYPVHIQDQLDPTGLKNSDINPLDSVCAVCVIVDVWLSTRVWPSY